MEIRAKPCGKALLSCAFDSGKSNACIVVEKVPEKNNGKQCIFGLDRSFYVREGYGFAGIITRLIEQAEVDVQRQQLELFYYWDYRIIVQLCNLMVGRKVM